jgi:predicted GNAT family acetyltransferase
MDVRRIADPAEFLTVAGPLLLDDEARHCLILGLATTLKDDPTAHPEHDLWIVETAGEVVGAALRTPPHNLAVARPRIDGALPALAAVVGSDVPGVVGALPEAELFADAWCAITGATRRLQFAQGQYALERVLAVSGVDGRMRDATPADRPVLLEWWRAFMVEAIHEEAPDPDEVAHALDRRISGMGSGTVVWDDGGPVSFACFTGPTPNGVRIGPVYTPPTERGRGYASALVADLSARLLAEGRRYCFLYTDLANPTANRIYVRIGYERVCDSASIAFVPSP